MRLSRFLTVYLVLALLAPAAVQSGPADGPIDRLEVTVRSADYLMVPAEGEQKIVMEGFGYRMQPGMPMLPEKKLLIALPPGALVAHIEARGVNGRMIPIAGRIAAAPPMVPLGESRLRRELAARMLREWRETSEAVYATDEAYPGELARITGSGGLRKYAYACVSICPFSYQPRSGRLVLFDEVCVTVHFSLPAPGSDRALETEALMSDRSADRRASELFINYGDVRDLYRVGKPERIIAQETYDYVIITADSIAVAITSSWFVTWKRMLGYNVKTVLVTDAEIAGQPGADLPEQIRNFLRSYYVPWGIEYVLIVGDYATVPMRYSFPDPTDHTHNPYNSGNPGGSVPSDNYYADLSLPDADSWDSDGDGYHGEYLEDNPDFLAEVYVGRIPTSDTTRVVYTLDKLVTFEVDVGAWKDRALQPGSILFFENQDYGGYPKIDGSTLLSQIELDIMSGWTVSRYTEKDGLDHSAFPWPPISEAAWTGDWQSGQYGVVNWSGHGAPHAVARTVWEWDDGDGVMETDGSDGVSWPTLIDCWSTLDDDYPSIVFAVSCNVGYPEPNGVGNLGIDLLTKQGFGAAAGIVSSTRPAWISADVINNPGGAESICYEFNRHEISLNEKLGEALYNAKFYCYQNYGWDHYAEHINQCNFNLYGDPSMKRIGAVPTAVDDGDLSDTQKHALLMQNFPNPFNPSTVIRFDLPRAAHVRLSVYNVNGELVAVLVDEHMDAGRKEIAWTAKDEGGGPLASGIYFYRLAAGDVVQTKKMVLLR